MARLFITIGVILVMVGLILAFWPRSFAWFGNLPGDIDIRRGGSRVFVPLTSMLVVSAAATLILNLIAWLLRVLR